MNPFEEYIKSLEHAHTEEQFKKFQKAFGEHKRIIILGNGGSNSVASHISQDYMKFHGKKVSVLSDPSMLTMLSNDFGYDKAYLKFLEYYAEKDTLVVLISSSGNSTNILNCMYYCEAEEIDYGILTGFDLNNKLRTRTKNSLWNYHVNSNSYGVVECVHQIFLHGVV
jgi:D-sedoheptulose 7-phosphate isomerase